LLSGFAVSHERGLSRVRVQERQACTHAMERELQGTRTRAGSWKIHQPRVHCVGQGVVVGGVRRAGIVGQVRALSHEVQCCTKTRQGGGAWKKLLRVSAEMFGMA
jgi:hypothetical protein